MTTHWHPGEADGDGAEIDAVLARYPNLAYSGWVVPPPTERERTAASRRRLAREEMLDPVVLAQFSLCRAFIAGHLGVEDPRGELISSIALKRFLERWHLRRCQSVYAC